MATQSYVEVYDSLCEYNWHELPIGLQKYILFMMLNIQKPLHYRGFIFTLDLETFTKVSTIHFWMNFSFFVFIFTLTTIVSIQFVQHLTTLKHFNVFNFKIWSIFSSKDDENSDYLLHGIQNRYFVRYFIYLFVSLIHFSKLFILFLKAFNRELISFLVDSTLLIRRTWSIRILEEFQIHFRLWFQPY